MTGPGSGPARRPDGLRQREAYRVRLGRLEDHRAPFSRCLEGLQRVASIDRLQIQSELKARVVEWQALLSRHERVARQILKGAAKVTRSTPGNRAGAASKATSSSLARAPRSLSASSPTGQPNWRSGPRPHPPRSAPPSRSRPSRSGWSGAVQPGAGRSHPRGSNAAGCRARRYGRGGPSLTPRLTPRNRKSAPRQANARD